MSSNFSVKLRGFEDKQDAKSFVKWLKHSGMDDFNEHLDIFGEEECLRYEVDEKAGEEVSANTIEIFVQENY